jgi:tetratricopeptide (TPR) repeat protein
LFDALVARLKGGDGGPRTWQGMAMFLNSQVAADDDRLPRIYDHFRENLRDVCRAGADAGAPVVVCTIPVNLKDCAPFASLHARALPADRLAAWDEVFKQGTALEDRANPVEALARYEEAARIDDRYAELAFRQGRCLAALGRHAEAKEKYSQARDLDTLRFRSDTTINRTIREVAAELAGRRVHLADAERAFEEASPNGIPGDELLLEHVHMNFAGNYLMARTVFREIAPALDARFGAAGSPEPIAERDAAARLGYTDWNELKIFSQILNDVLRTPPFTNHYDRAAHNATWEAKVRGLREKANPAGLRQAAAIYQKAVEQAEQDWMIRMNYGLLLTEVGDLPGAEEQCRAVLGRMHHCFPAHCMLGRLYTLMGRLEMAEQHFRDALRLNPDWAEAHRGLADTLGAKGKTDEGVAIYEDRLTKDADRGGTLMAMAMFLLRSDRLDDARRRLTDAIPLRPGDPNPHALLGEIADRQGRREEAAAHFEDALKVRPDWPEIKARLAEVKAGPPPKGPK